MVSTWREKIQEAARAHAERLALEEQRPELRAERHAAQEAERLAQRKAHEATQRAGAAGHLERCGLRTRDASRVAAGLSADWGVVGDGAQATSALRAARAWWKSDKVLLLLVGAPGTGKTCAVGELLARVRLDYVHPDLGRTWCWPTTTAESAAYVLAGDLAGDVFAEDMGKRRDRLQRVRLLVVDELGAEVMSSPWQSLLQNILVNRHAAGLKTALVSNMGGQAFRQRYGAVVFRRLNEDGTTVSLGTETLSGSEVGHG